MIRDAKYKKGEVIYREGDEAKAIYFLKFGSVQLYVDFDKEDRKLIAIVPEGRVFGELGVIEDMPHTTTSVAGEETILTIVDKESFPSYIQEHPNKMLTIMENLSYRIRLQSQKLVKATKVVAAYAEEKEKNGFASNELREKLKTLSLENKKAKR